jgi:hypothetical protein
MPTGIKHRDKNIAVTQESEFGQLTQMKSCGPDISPVRSEIGSTRPEVMLFSKSSYTALEAMFGVLYGSI